MSSDASPNPPTALRATCFYGNNLATAKRHPVRAWGVSLRGKRPLRDRSVAHAYFIYMFVCYFPLDSVTASCWTEAARLAGAQSGDGPTREAAAVLAAGREGKSRVGHPASQKVTMERIVREPA